MELILTDEEYYDLFKALRFGIEQLPDLLAERKNVLDRMVALYKTSPDACQFVITAKDACQYPGCSEQATIECHTIGCTHKVCETHGNCSAEISPDEQVPICWYCCGKGWSESNALLSNSYLKATNLWWFMV